MYLDRKTEISHQYLDHQEVRSVPMDNPFAIAISAGELVSRDDRDGALLLLAETEAQPEHLAQAALEVLAHVMSGDHAAERFAELRTDVHRLAEHVGAQDGQVIMCLEAVAAAEALADDDPDRACAILDGSTFSPLDATHVAAAFVGQAVAGWVGRDRAPGVFAALRRHYGIGAA